VSGAAVLPGDAPVREVMEVIDATRALFHVLKVVADDVHGPDGLTAGARGVLQSLYEGGPRTVPQMARQRPVSRQHIQTLVNELLEDGHVVLTANPRHKRSMLVRLTPSGRRLFEGVRSREARLLRALRVEDDAEELHAAAGLLRRLRSAMADPGWRALLTTRVEHP